MALDNLISVTLTDDEFPPIASLHWGLSTFNPSGCIDARTCPIWVSVQGASGATAGGRDAFHIGRVRNPQG